MDRQHTDVSSLVDTLFEPLEDTNLSFNSFLLWMLVCPSSPFEQELANRTRDQHELLVQLFTTYVNAVRLENGRALANYGLKVKSFEAQTF